MKLGEWQMVSNAPAAAGQPLAIEARGLVKKFDGFTAVDGVDLTVPQGSIYGILGPNGAGKTTTLRMMLGIIDPDSGIRRVLGHDRPHEVAHAIFDSVEGVAVTYQASSSKYNKNDYQEIRANSFASCYLMPPSMLKKLPQIDRSSALHWAQQFRVSTAALAKALKDAGRVDESGARAIRSARVSADN